MRQSHEENEREQMSVACMTSGLGEYIVKHQIAAALCTLVTDYYRESDESGTGLAALFTHYMKIKTSKCSQRCDTT